MITATLFIYGLGEQVNHSECRFLQLPSPGDLVALRVPGKIHYATVRHVEHTVASVHFADQEPSAIVVSDWKSTYDEDQE